MARRRLTYPSYRQPSNVTFGTGSVRALARPEVLDRAVIFMSGDKGVGDALASAFANQGITFAALRTLAKPPGEPSVESIAAAASWLAAHEHETVIAVGGGSVLDWARLAMATARGWLDLQTGQMRPDVPVGDRVRLELVPTTCGSGAEAAAVAVYTAQGRKVAVVSDAFIADRVILDAQFLSTASPAALASSLSDALSHSIEAFVSIVPNALAKQAAVAALQSVLQHYTAVDLHCRNERLMEAGYLGGVAASNCSVGVVHAFAHSMAAYDLPHGVGNALALAAGINVNAETSEMRGLLERAGFARAEALIDAVRPITSSALRGVTTRAQAALATPAEREAIAERMLTDVCLRTNPRRLERDGVFAFLDDVDRALGAV